MAARTSMTSYYRYIVSSFDILLPGAEPIAILNGNINELTIEKDYDNDFFPIMHMNINIQPDIYYKIITNKTTVKFRIRLDKYRYDKDNVRLFKQMVFNDIFTIYTDNNNQFLDEELYKRTKDISGGKVMTSDFGTSYDFYFFKEKDMNASNRVINTVISKGNMINIITYMLATAGYSNILMGAFDNNTVYNEVILLPQTVLANIDYLDKQYGFYNYGKLVFFDYDTAYFIPKRAMCVAYRANEYKDVLVMCNKSINPNSMTPGNYKDDKQKCYILNITKDQVHMSTDSVIADQIEGNKIISVSPSTGAVNNIAPAIQQRGQGTAQLMVNNYNNPFTNKSVEYRKIENDNIVTVNFADIDMECMVPNKRFVFSFEDSSVQQTRGGDYRLAGTLFTFNKEGTEFSVTGTSHFKKIK